MHSYITQHMLFYTWIPRYVVQCAYRNNSERFLDFLIRLMTSPVPSSPILESIPHHKHANNTTI